MKLYLRLLSLTLSLGFIFVIGYLSGLLMDTSSDWWFSVAGNVGPLPSPEVFEWVWVAVYILIVVLLTPTVAERKLRSALPLWLTVGALNVIWVLSFFTMHFTLLGLAVLLTEVALLAAITDFYIRNTRYLWSAMIPVLGWYLFMTVLNFDVLV